MSLAASGVSQPVATLSRTSRARPTFVRMDPTVAVQTTALGQSECGGCSAPITFRTRRRPATPSAASGPAIDKLDQVLHAVQHDAWKTVHGLKKSSQVLVDVDSHVHHVPRRSRTVIAPQRPQHVIRAGSAPETRCPPH
jgi:hypothetical protein